MERISNEPSRRVEFLLRTLDRTKEGNYMHQAKYTKELIKCFGMENLK